MGFFPLFFLCLVFMYRVDSTILQCEFLFMWCVKENKVSVLPRKEAAFSGTCARSYAHVREASFPFLSTLKFAGISGYLRPNTLSCTCLSTNRILVSHQVPRTLVRQPSFLKGDTNLTKEGNFSTAHCSNCKHFMCHTHKNNATEVTKIRLK